MGGSVKDQHRAEHKFPQLLRPRLNPLSGSVGVAITQKNLAAVRIVGPQTQLLPDKFRAADVGKLSQHRGPVSLGGYLADRKIFIGHHQRHPIQTLSGGQCSGAQLPPGHRHGLSLRDLGQQRRARTG